MTRLIEKLVGDFDDKKRWRAYKARVKALPPGYRTAVDAIERYLMQTGAGTDTLIAMVEDLADLFEQAAADRTPIRTIVGDDPVDFTETFKRNYGQSAWLGKQQQRLTQAIEHAENDENARDHNARDHNAQTDDRRSRP